MTRRFIMKTYSGWETDSRNHQGHAFLTSTLLELERHLPEKMSATAETGCGKSTIMFSNLSESHRVFAIDDRSEGESSSIRFFEDCPLTRLDRLSLHLGPTQITLPSFPHNIKYDAVLIDGPHGYPFPEIEYLSFYPHIKTGGFLIIDDVNIPTIGRLADFIYEDEMFDFVALCAATAIFRRTDAPTFDPTGDGWWSQQYNRRRVSRKREIHLCEGQSLDFISSQNLDAKLHGD